MAFVVYRLVVVFLFSFLATKVIRISDILNSFAHFFASFFACRFRGVKKKGGCAPMLFSYSLPPLGYSLIGEVAAKQTEEYEKHIGHNPARD